MSIKKDDENQIIITGAMNKKHINQNGCQVAIFRALTWRYISSNRCQIDLRLFACVHMTAKPIGKVDAKM